MVEGDEPEREDLGDFDVAEEGCFVKGCRGGEDVVSKGICLKLIEVASSLGLC